jgi:hypothetical protein
VPGAKEVKISTHSMTWQSAMYFPWLSSPASTPATRVLLPCSVDRAITAAITPPINLCTPVDSQSKSDLHAPGVMQLMMTSAEVDFALCVRIEPIHEPQTPLSVSRHHT